MWDVMIHAAHLYALTTRIIQSIWRAVRFDKLVSSSQTPWNYDFCQDHLAKETVKDLNSPWERSIWIASCAASHDCCLQGIWVLERNIRPRTSTVWNPRGPDTHNTPNPVLMNSIHKTHFLYQSKNLVNENECSMLIRPRSGLPGTLVNEPQ